MYVVPYTTALPAPVPPAGPPGRRPRSLVAATILVVGSLVVSAAGVVVLAVRMDDLLAAVGAPFHDLLQLGVTYVAVVWTAFWTACCLPFAIVSYHGRDWARITLTVVLVVKTVANLGGGRIVARFAIAATGLYGPLGVVALLLTVATAVLDVVAVVLLWRRPTSAWFSAAAAHRTYLRAAGR